MQKILVSTKTLYPFCLVSLLGFNLVSCSSAEVKPVKVLISTYGNTQIDYDSTEYTTKKFSDKMYPGMIINNSAPKHIIGIKRDSNHDQQLADNNMLSVKPFGSNQSTQVIVELPNDQPIERIVQVDSGLNHENNSFHDGEMIDSTQLKADTNSFHNSDNKDSSDLVEPSENLMVENGVNSYISNCDCLKVADVFFSLNSSEVSSEQLAAIDKLDVFEKSLEVIGLSDSLGEGGYNRNLASSRSNTVHEILMLNGAKEVFINSGLQSSLTGPEFRKVIILGL